MEEKGSGSEGRLHCPLTSLRTHTATRLLPRPPGAPSCLCCRLSGCGRLAPLGQPAFSQTRQSHPLSNDYSLLAETDAGTPGGLTEGQKVLGAVATSVPWPGPSGSVTRLLAQSTPSSPIQGVCVRMELGRKTVLQLTASSGATAGRGQKRAISVGQTRPSYLPGSSLG